jgi:hypothetical protein
VLELDAYDAILGYDWLKIHNPMICHWELKHWNFRNKGGRSIYRGFGRSNYPCQLCHMSSLLSGQK